MTTTAPPGMLTGKLPPPGCRLAVPGFYHLNFLPGASDHEWIATDTAGQHHDGDLVFGETEAHGAIRVHYDTPDQWRAVALACLRIADWLEKIA